MKVLELFAGIGACSKALERLGIEHEIVDAVEIDKYAIASFNAIHGTNFEPQDITTWDKDIDVDLIMHGSPCQDFSLAGKQAGGDKDSGTRSSLMYETIRIVKKLKPKYVIWENVKNLLSKKHRHNFDSYLEIMEKLGYANYYQVLNAKDYGIPQNRERVFTVSIRADVVFREEINFDFPPKQELKLKLKDMLEENVDEKYYLSNAMIKYISATGTANFKNPDCKINLDIARPLTTDQNKRAGTTNYLSSNLPDNYNLNEVKRIYGIFDKEKQKHQAGSVYDKNGLAPTLNTMQGGWRQPSIITYNITQKVKVRKYVVDTKKLVETLRNAKLELDITNKELAEKLNIPITQIEHYFRKDNSFAIPEAQIWLKLKEILKIETNEFDESIMTFEEKDGVYEKANRIYGENGLAPTLTQQEEKILINNGTKKGYSEAHEGDSVNLSYPNSKTRRGKVGEQVSQTLQCNDAMGVVLKNNKCAKHQQDLLQSDDGVCRTIPAGTHGSTPHLLKTLVNEQSQLKIRKLTPKECWRLMGFDDEDFEKAEKVNSNTQLYKQAGNSIVVNVLEAILKNLLIKEDENGNDN